jgi:hypothetical protein
MLNRLFLSFDHLDVKCVRMCLKHLSVKYFHQNIMHAFRIASFGTAHFRDFIIFEIRLLFHGRFCYLFD